jgi:serine protease Do
MKRSLFKTIAPWVLGLAGGVLVIVGTSRAFDWPVATKVAAEASVPVAVNDAPLDRDPRLGNSFAPVVKKLAPTVVNISTTKNVKQTQMRPMFDDPFFRQFFGDQFRGSGRNARPFKEHSLGSGVIVSKDGYILSNNHVVDGADEIKVLLAKGKKEYDAKVVGRDPKTDVAVLKIDAKDLPFATLGNSDNVEVGDVVLAVGSPFGLAQTVTMGIVSAMGRNGMGVEDYEDFIQTDAAINPGNSGGPLADAEGRVVGINTFILSGSGGNQGVGFAVPINLARNIMDRLIKTGKVERGYLGVWIQDLTPALAEQFNVRAGQGALVGEVTDDSPAAEVGLKNGDVIIEFNGKTVTDNRQFRFAVAQCAPGTKVTLKVLRQGREKTFEVTLKELPNQTLASKGGGGEQGDTTSDALNGVTVGDLDSATRNQLNIPARVRGAVVVDIDQDSPAYEAGLRQGDIIQEINREPVKSADEAVEASKRIKNKHILLRVYSNGGSRYIPVDESKKKSE